MLRFDQDLTGQLICARDGDIGAVSDCYFDGFLSVVRYLVVETSGWLSGRHVLLAPEAVEMRAGNDAWLSTGVTLDQIRQSPPIDMARPVSREHENRLRAHFGWAECRAPTARLHSVRSVVGCTVRGLDGDIGHVVDVLIDEEAWDIRYVVLDARSWLPGRRIVLAPSWFSGINWITGRMRVDLSRDAVRTSPRLEPTMMVTDEYCSQLHDHYRPHLRALSNKVEVPDSSTEAVASAGSRGSSKS